MPVKINWAVWSGEGECGSKKIKTATLTGIKRILTIERCGGDRFAHACPAHWPEAEFCAAAREFDLENCSEFDLDNCSENDVLKMAAAQK
jgi:hypothetical protein